MTKICFEDWSSRFALGSLWLGALTVAGYGKDVLPALPFAAIIAVVGGRCSREVYNLRAAKGAGGRNAIRFGCIWCILLSKLGALAGGARALAGTLDALSEGRARHWLFGENLAPPLHMEPWPDPLAVAAIALLCLMFMCGLENSTTLTLILISSVVSGTIFFVIAGGIKLDFTFWNERGFFSNGVYGFLVAAACCTYIFPGIQPVLPTMRTKVVNFAMVVIPIACTMSIAAIFCFISPYREYSESAVPLVQVFQTHDPSWARPAMASFTVVALALAITAILPQIVGILVMLSGSDWKVLTKILAYESSTTGSQVLAIFSAGSLSAILAFACPMIHLVKLTCGGQVFVWAIESAMLLHMRSLPEDKVDDPTDVCYKRLPHQNRPDPLKQSRGARIVAGLWFLPRSVRQSTQVDAQKILKGGDERECLLLDEYASQKTEGTEFEPSDQSEPSDHQNLSSTEEESTDIDAVVKEYKDKITVVSSIPDANGGNIAATPSLGSSKRATFGAIVVFCSSFAISIGIATGQPAVISIFAMGFIGGVSLCWWQPVAVQTLNALVCGVSCFASSLLAVPLLADAWPALALFTVAGFIMYSRHSGVCGAVPRRRGRPPPLLGAQSARLTHLDTVYISR